MLYVLCWGRAKGSAAKYSLAETGRISNTENTRLSRIFIKKGHDHRFMVVSFFELTIGYVPEDVNSLNRNFRVLITHNCNSD